MVVDLYAVLLNLHTHPRSDVEACFAGTQLNISFAVASFLTHLIPKRLVVVRVFIANGSVEVGRNDDFCIEVEGSDRITNSPRFIIDD